jgi:hypothetical protein
MRSALLASAAAATSRASTLCSSPLPRRCSAQRWASTSSAGKSIQCNAAVAWKKGEPLTVERIDVAAPQPTEVRIRMVASGVCHTDQFTLSGEDPEGAFPVILGHEGGGIVESVGAEVKVSDE